MLMMMFFLQRRNERKGLMGAEDVGKNRRRPRVMNTVRENSKVWGGISGRGQTGLEQKAAAGLEMRLPWKNLGLVKAWCLHWQQLR